MVDHLMCMYDFKLFIKNKKEPGRHFSDGRNGMHIRKMRNTHEYQRVVIKDGIELPDNKTIENRFKIP